jgi:Ca2+-binding EF-hand superfamily protein
MSSISGIGGNYGMMMQGMGGMKRPDPTQMADKLFSKLDSSGQGYIQKSDLQAAFDKISSSSSSSSSGTSSSVDDLFSKLDTNSDGKVTKQEFSDTLKKVADQLDNQFMSMRMNGGMQGGGMGGGMSGMMDGMPPGGDSGGLTKDQLTSMSNNIDSSDSTASSSIKNLVNNFDKADTDGDGKISMKEAMAYKEKTASSSSSTSTASTSSNDLNTQILSQITKLMQAYGIGNDQSSQSGIGNLLSTISVSA